MNARYSPTSAAVTALLLAVCTTTTLAQVPTLPPSSISNAAGPALCGIFLPNSCFHSLHLQPATRSARLQS